jgi:formamidopyrimidine-DNA glycosylase
MPEGIEVRILIECLKPIYLGKTIKSTKFIGGRYIKHSLPDGYTDFAKTAPYKIVDIGSKGKFIYFILMDSKGDKWSMFNTLGMTGIWLAQPDKHTTFVMEMSDKVNLYFSDIRNFGTFKFLRDPELKQLNKKLTTLGLEIFNPHTEFTQDKFAEKIAKSPTKTLPEILMNQKNFAGIGNYIKAEALYHAHLSPHRTGKSLSKQDINNLYEAIKYVVYTAYFAGNYYEIVDITGEKHENIKCRSRELTREYLGIKKGVKEYEFEVYNREKDTKGNKVERLATKDGRTTFWVPTVQK